MKAIRPILAFILLLAALSAAAQKPAPPVTNINRVKPPASLPKTVLDGGLTLTNVGDRAAFALELGVMASGASVTLLNGATGALTLTTRAGYGITDALSLDSDLTAIAALSTAGLGRSLLTLADAAAGRAAIGAGVSKFNGSFAAPTGLPTTLAGLGTTDTVAGGHGTRMVADNDARDEATPDFVGQLLIQSDVGAIFRGTALTAGAWSYGFLLHNSTGAVPVQLSLGANSLGGFLNGAARWSIDNSTGAASFASIFGPLTGNATSATALAAGNTINGVNFTGAAPITVPAAAGTLTGGALAAGVTSAPGLLAASGGPFGAGAFITAQPAYTVFGNATGSTSAPVFANTLTLSDAVRKTVAITAISAGTPATFTAPGHTFVVGEKIIMCGLNGAAGQSDTSGNFAFNSFFGMTVTAKTATTFQTNATVPGGTAQGGLTHAFAGLTNAAQAIIQGNADVYGSTKGNLLLRVANANVNDQGTGIVLEATDHSSPPTLWTNWLFGAQNGLQIGPGLTVLNGGVMGYGLAVFNTNDTATTVSPG